MKLKKIDKLPPSPSGDIKKDVDALANYLCYLQEQINYQFELQNRRITKLEEKE